MLNYRQEEMEYRIANFEESLTSKIVSMWRPSKQLAVGQEDIHSIEEDIDFINEVLSKDNTIRLVIDSNQKVLAMIAFNSTSVSQLYVDIDCINQGIGSKLLQLVKDQAADTLELYTYQRNEIAKSFYQKHGFVEVGRNYENELNLPDVKLRWERASTL